MGELTNDAIVVSHLRKTYGTHIAVDDLSFTVATGEIFGLLGPNGAGKTSTIEMLEGYRTADAGTVRVLGVDPQSQPAELRSRIGVMLQDGGVSPATRILPLLRLYSAFYTNGMSVEEALELTGCSDRPQQLVRKCSGGERQRISLVLALMGRPELLFLDEPTAGMDPRAREATLSLIRSVAAQGTTVLLSTHLLDEAEQLCDRILIIDRGKQVALDSPQHLVRSGERKHVLLRIQESIDLQQFAAELGIAITAIHQHSDGELLIDAIPTPNLISNIAQFLAAHQVQLLSIDTGSRRLEDVFLALTTDG